MRNDGSLGQAGGAAGVEDHEPVFRLRDDRRAAAVLPRHQLLILLADLDLGAFIPGSQIEREVRFHDQQLR